MKNKQLGISFIGVLFVVGVFAFVGAGNAFEEILYPHHHPRFNVDEASLDIGLRYLTAATLDLLS